MGTRGQVGQQANTYPVGQVLVGLAPAGDPVAGLLGQEGLGPGLDADKAQATLGERPVQLLQGQPLQAALPEKSSGQPGCW